MASALYYEALRNGTPSPPQSPKTPRVAPPRAMGSRTAVALAVSSTALLSLGAFAGAALSGVVAQRHAGGGAEVPDVCGHALQQALEAASPPTSPTLACMVVTAYPQQEPSMRVNLEAWMRQCDHRAFLVADDPASHERPPERFITGEPYEHGHWGNSALFPLAEARVIAANVTGGGRECVGNNPECWKEGFLWRKVWQLYLKVYDEYIAKALAPGGGGWDSVPEWFVKADDDTFVFVSHLRATLLERGFSPDDPHYLGHALTHNKEDKLPKGFISGTCLILSRGAFKALAEKALSKIPARTLEVEAAGGNLRKECADRGGPQEDLSTGFCLSEIGIHAEDLADSRGRALNLVMQLKDHLTSPWGLNELGEDKMWFWHDQPKENSLSESVPSLDSVISIHSFKGAERTRRMYEFAMYEANEWRIKREAVSVVERACAAH